MAFPILLLRKPGRGRDHRQRYGVGGCDGVAHQQIEWADHTLAFSTRLGKGGNLLIEVDVGSPG